MRIATLASALLAATVLATPAPADEASPKSRFHQYLWEQLDTDGDGAISRAESEARRAALFQAADLDRDGVLNFDEMQEYIELRRQARKLARFKVIDTNGDGVISADELGQVADRFWARLDADGDDRVTPEELRQGRHRHHHRR